MASYGLFSLVNEKELASFVTARNYAGLNVTIPYKKTVIPYLDHLSEEAAAIGAVNVIENYNGELTGYNTDCMGFELAMQEWLSLNQSCANALVLGTGGSARSITFVLQKYGISYRYISRKKYLDYLTYDSLTITDIKEADLLVNCTPVGMWPHTSKAPIIPYEALSDKHYVFDLVYNPEKTLFLERAAAQGCRTQNGMKMLVEQAEEAWRIWNRPNKENEV